MAQQRFRPTVYAPLKALDDLRAVVTQLDAETGAAVAQLNRVQVIFEKALVSVMQDVESITQVLVEAGLLEDAEEGVEEEVELPEGQVAVDVPVEEATDAEDLQEASTDVEDRAIAEDARIEALTEEEFNAGFQPGETPAQRTARIEARRAQRLATRDEIVGQFEAANESDPIEAETDPNAIAGLPEEGVTLEPGIDPLTGEFYDVGN